MSTGFFSRILPGCQHQFAWPRRDESGGYYQLCVCCGCKYSYDWTKMRRMRKVSTDENTLATVHRSERRVAWTPRERRLSHHVPVSIKVFVSEEWQPGISENISHSGLLFTCAMQLEESQTLELKLELPKELTGETPAQVVCLGRVARVTEIPATSKAPRTFLVACSIDDYEFASRTSARAAVQTMKVVEIKKHQNIG